MKTRTHFPQSSWNPKLWRPPSTWRTNWGFADHQRESSLRRELVPMLYGHLSSVLSYLASCGKAVLNKNPPQILLVQLSNRFFSVHHTLHRNGEKVCPFSSCSATLPRWECRTIRYFVLLFNCFILIVFIFVLRSIRRFYICTVY